MVRTRCPQCAQRRREPDRFNRRTAPAALPSVHADCRKSRCAVRPRLLAAWRDAHNPMASPFPFHAITSQSVDPGKAAAHPILERAIAVSEAVSAHRIVVGGFIWSQRIQTSYPRTPGQRQAWELDDTDKAEQLLRNLARRHAIAGSASIQGLTNSSSPRLRQSYGARSPAPTHREHDGERASRLPQWKRWRMPPWRCGRAGM